MEVLYYPVGFIAFVMGVWLLKNVDSIAAADGVKVVGGCIDFVSAVALLVTSLRLLLGGWTGPVAPLILWGVSVVGAINLVALFLNDESVSPAKQTFVTSGLGLAALALWEIDTQFGSSGLRTVLGWIALGILVISWIIYLINRKGKKTRRKKRKGKKAHRSNFIY